MLLERGMVQGLRELRERNWQAPPLDAVRLAELLRWLRDSRRPPDMTWYVHGEPEAAAPWTDR